MNASGTILEHLRRELQDRILYDASPFPIVYLHEAPISECAARVTSVRGTAVAIVVIAIDHGVADGGIFARVAAAS